MNIAYLMNTYPMTSTTFVRCEIEALESRGLKIKCYACRHWPVKLVDSLDLKERKRTEYLLSGNLTGLLVAFAREIVANPDGLWRGIRACRKLATTAGGQHVKHVAYLLQAICLRQKSRRDVIDHIHVHFSTNATAIAMLCRLMGGPSYSFTVHGPDEFVEACRLSLGDKLANSAFAVAISHYCKAQLIRFSSMALAHKIHVIRCGLALEEFEPSSQFSADNQTFVCIGRLCPQKAQVMIPGAVASLRAGFPKLKVILIGDGDGRAAVTQEIAAHGVVDMLELRGWMANVEIREILRTCRALLLPSFAEGLPVVIMEAFALGRPAISTYIAGIPELIDDSCGWIVPAGSEQHLIAAMRSALQATPAELARKGAEGRARVLQHHNLDNISRTLHHCLQDAVDARRESCRQNAPTEFGKPA